MTVEMAMFELDAGASLVHEADATVWAVTCLFARAGFRKRGISRALARGAVDFAREPRGCPRAYGCRSSSVRGGRT